MKYIDAEKLISEVRTIQQSLENRDVRFNQVKKIQTECMIEFCKAIFDVIVSLQQEEPVSEELEDAAKNYAANITDKIGYKLQLRRAVVYGAKLKELQFERERLKHCEALTNEQAQIESDFVSQHLKKNNRTPTFIDAIEYGMKKKERADDVKGCRCESKG